MMTTPTSATRLRVAPINVDRLIPDGWPAAWESAMTLARVERIVALGNGDERHVAKADALRRRRKPFDELIRTRTLVGLHAQMPEVSTLRVARSSSIRASTRTSASAAIRAPCSSRIAVSTLSAGGAGVVDARGVGGRLHPHWHVGAQRAPPGKPPRALVESRQGHGMERALPRQNAARAAQPGWRARPLASRRAG